MKVAFSGTSSDSTLQSFSQTKCGMTWYPSEVLIWILAATKDRDLPVLKESFEILILYIVPTKAPQYLDDLDLIKPGAFFSVYALEHVLANKPEQDICPRVDIIASRALCWDCILSIYYSLLCIVRKQTKNIYIKRLFSNAKQAILDSSDLHLLLRLESPFNLDFWCLVCSTQLITWFGYMVWVVLVANLERPQTHIEVTGS